MTGVELFSVYDAAANRYMDPFCAPTLEFALRGFREACEKEGHQFNMYPEDYTLYSVGSFDAELGDLLSPHIATKVAVATTFATPAVQLDIEQQIKKELA